MKLHDFTERIGSLIGKDDLKTAINEMNILLKNSDKLNEVILQSARFTDLTRQIRMGSINVEDANVNKNKIRLGILSLLQEIEESAISDPEILAEVEAVPLPRYQTNITQTHSGSGDNIGRDKVESHAHTHLETFEREKKSKFAYYGEVFIIFFLTVGVGGGMLGAFGYAVGKEVGAIIGVIIGLGIGFVNASSVKRTKGLL